MFPSQLFAIISPAEESLHGLRVERVDFFIPAASQSTDKLSSMGLIIFLKNPVVEAKLKVASNLPLGES